MFSPKKEMVIIYDLMEVLANLIVVIILQCIKSTHCIPQTYRMLYVNYINKAEKIKKEF